MTNFGNICLNALESVSMSSLSAEQQEEVQDFLAGLENDDDVQHVYTNLDPASLQVEA